MSDDIQTDRLPPEPKLPPMNPNNIDWTTEILIGRLYKVPRIYNQDDVNKALYSAGSHILSSYTAELNVEPGFDLNKSRAKLVDYINDLLNDSAPARSVLSTGKEQGGYAFKTVSGLHAMTPKDFKQLQSENPGSFDQILKDYQQERLVLVQAMEQALTLIVRNPVLKNLISTYLLYVNNISADDLADLHDQVRTKGLKIWIENTWSGFDGNKNNHGKLVYTNEGIRLNLNLQGQSSIPELVHEFAAFLILKEKNIEIHSEQNLADAKMIHFFYILLIMDLLVAGVSHTRRYTNLAAGLD